MAKRAYIYIVWRRTCYFIQRRVCVCGSYEWVSRCTTSSETIHAKQNFEQLAASHGVTIQSYLADNGTFKAHSFEHDIHDSNQMIKYCGVNAHHQNGIAERNIRTVSNRARAMLLHAAIHWKDAVSSSLWPMAVQYAVYQHNHLPNKEGHAPADLFTGTTFPWHKLFQMHTWGCPVYVLDPKLQQGKVIRAACMEECNGKPTPASEEPLGKDADGDPFTEEWKYSEVVGMLLYLANNSRPDIAYAVHQCAWFTHDPKASHAEGVKRIIRYLQGTKDKGILLRPDESQGVDCYVNADFAGLWKSEDSQDPVSVKSSRS